jgi:hypothetical protein
MEAPACVGALSPPAAHAAPRRTRAFAAAAAAAASRPAAPPQLRRAAPALLHHRAAGARRCRRGAAATPLAAAAAGDSTAAASPAAAASSAERYAARGVSASKEDVHAAIAALDKGLFPSAFCKARAAARSRGHTHSMLPPSRRARKTHKPSLDKQPQNAHALPTHTR